MKKKDVLKGLDAWFEDIEEDIKEDLMSAEFYDSGHMNSTHDERIEVLEDIRNMLMFSSSPFEFMDSLFHDYVYEAKSAERWEEFPITDSFIRRLFYKFLKDMKWEDD